MASVHRAFSSVQLSSLVNRTAPRVRATLSTQVRLASQKAPVSCSVYPNPRDSQIENLKRVQIDIKTIEEQKNKHTPPPEDDVKDKDGQQLSQNLKRSSVSLLGGAAYALFFPIDCILPGLATPVSNFLMSLSATYAAQPLVVTKLKLQAGAKDGNINPGKNQFPPKDWVDQVGLVARSKDGFKGGGAYALRGASAKMMMFLGFEKVDAFLKPIMPDLPTPIRQMLAGALSGMVQGAFMSPIEWVSTLQSKYPDKSLKEIRKMIMTYAEKNGVFGPIGGGTGRNATYDAVFNTLSQAGTPFPIAAVISMTLAYPCEMVRSLSQQGTPKEAVTEYVTSRRSKEGARDAYPSWFAKAMEFLVIYSFLQMLMALSSYRKDKLKAPDSKGTA